MIHAAPTTSSIRGWTPTKILQMHPNLVHTACERFAQDHTAVPIETELLECGRTFLSLGRNLAYTDLVADYFDWLLALDDAAVGRGRDGDKKTETHEQESRTDETESIPSVHPVGRPVTHTQTQPYTRATQQEL